jgi:hypothetical protein
MVLPTMQGDIARNCRSPYEAHPLAAETAIKDGPLQRGRNRAK